MHVAFNKLRNTLESLKGKPMKRLSLSPVQEEMMLRRRFVLLEILQRKRKFLTSSPVKLLTNLKLD